MKPASFLRGMLACGTLFAMAGLGPAAGSNDARNAEICGDCKVKRFAACEGKHFLEGPAFDRSGQLWVTGLESGAVLRIATDGKCTEVAKAGQAINGSKFDARGRLLLTDAMRGLLRFDTATREVTVLRGSYGRETFRGLNDSVVDKSGGIYFTESWGSHALRRDGCVFYLPADDVDQGSETWWWWPAG